MSAMTPEGKIKKTVTALLKQHGLWYFFPAANGMGRAGIPDVIAIVDGHFLGIEVKADKTKKPTELQKLCGREIEAAGGTWLVVCDAITLAVLAAVIENRKDKVT
jgi:hypothetical protein